MREFSKSELRRLDVTLLLVFVGLLRHRKALAVADELGLTQSGVSQALRRLRDIFDDELFLRRPHGLEPTALALGLERPVSTAIEALRGALGRAQSFDPASENGVLRIAALDAEQAVIVPGLARALGAEAPGLRVAVLPLGRVAAIDALTEGRADLALGFIWDRPDSISAEPLHEETYRVAGPAGALPEAPQLSLEHYLASDHILVSPAGDLRGIVDRVLDGMGRERRVVLAMSAFVPALAAAAETGSLVTLPSQIALAFAPSFGLVTALPPVRIRPFTVSCFWHRRNDRDARLAWVRGRLRAALQPLPGTPASGHSGSAPRAGRSAGDP